MVGDKSDVRPTGKGACPPKVGVGTAPNAAAAVARAANAGADGAASSRADKDEECPAPATGEEALSQNTKNTK